MFHTVMSFFGTMNVGEAHCDDDCIFMTAIDTSLFISFIRVALCICGMGYLSFSCRCGMWFVLEMGRSCPVLSVVGKCRNMLARHIADLFFLPCFLSLKCHVVIL
jgi:hypothetical protein